MNTYLFQSRQDAYRLSPSGRLRFRHVSEGIAALARGFAWSKDGKSRFFVTEAQRIEAGLVSLMPPGARRVPRAA